MFSRHFSDYLTEYPIISLQEINIFHKNNKNLLKYFLFFFVVAICGYASILTSRYPHSDDYSRYLINYSCGFNCRYGAWLLEMLLSFSHFVSDAAPFSQIISCIMLSYIAIICLKALGADVYIESIKTKNFTKYAALLCFIPVVVNPYLMEIMIFRFDNIHMTFALLCATLSAYLSTKNNKGCLIFQIIFLFYSLIFYQAAISAYFIFFFINLLKEIASGKSVKDTIFYMRYWFLTMLITAVIYWPFVYQVEYAKKDGELFIIPYNLENIKSIFENIMKYLSDLKDDWSHHFVGRFTAFLMLTASISFIRETWISSQERKTAVVFLIIILVGLLLSPYGINIFLNYINSRMVKEIAPRVLYCFGILLSFVFFKNYLMIVKRNAWVKKAYITFLFFLGIWNIVIVNSANNILYMQNVLQHNVFYDLGKDLNEILQKNKKKKMYICHEGSIMTPTMKFFIEECPIFGRIMIETWTMINYCLMGFYCHSVANSLLAARYNLARIKFNGKYSISKKLLKSHLWYDIYILDEKIIKVTFKEGRKINVVDVLNIKS